MTRSISIRTLRGSTLAALGIFLSFSLAIGQPPGELVLRDVYLVPHDLRFENTLVGGLSGIDYDPSADTYFIISDDRSALQPARYYEAKIRLSPTGIDTVEFIRKIELIGPTGSTYPSFRQSPHHTIDPEALRRNPSTGDLVWLSEGERILRAKDTVLVNPAIVVTREGRYSGEYPLPDNARITGREWGPRQNGAFEAMCFGDSGQWLWVAMEEPLYQDGPRADVADTFSPVRFYRFDAATRKNTAQYAYDLEPVAYAPIVSSAFRVNGVTDILDAGNRQLLVVERSFSTGRLPCTVKIFLADFNAAQDVKDLPSLKEGNVKTASKRLLLNLDTLNIYIDNVEGITWGPLFANGNRTLLLVTDNNFQSIQKTQVFLFEVIPGK